MDVDNFACFYKWISGCLSLIDRELAYWFEMIEVSVVCRNKWKEDQFVGFGEYTIKMLAAMSEKSWME